MFSFANGGNAVTTGFETLPQSSEYAASSGSSSTDGIHCYIAGIPFIKGTIIGSFFYTYLLFGGYYLLQEKIYFLKRSHINY